MESAQVMHRLIQGDVGAGKTMVAWFSSLRVIENGFQAVWMAPTELLAEQHFRNLQPYAEKLAIKARLITGSMPAKERKAALDEISKGGIQLIVGTHALIQEGVHVPGMALGVIDEQHRFGVVQRLSLQRIKGHAENAISLTGQPHMLLMSATPIPRSLAMVLYGDMEVSVMDEMPPGRLPVKTKLFTESQRKTVYTRFWNNCAAAIKRSLFIRWWRLRNNCSMFETRRRWPRRCANRCLKSLALAWYMVAWLAPSETK